MSVVPGLNISSSIFEGTSFTVDNKTKPEDIETLAEVATLWPVRIVKKPNPKINAVGPDTQPSWTSHGMSPVTDNIKSPEPDCKDSEYRRIEPT